MSSQCVVVTCQLDEDGAARLLDTVRATLGVFDVVSLVLESLRGVTEGGEGVHGRSGQWSVPDVGSKEEESFRNFRFLSTPRARLFPLFSGKAAPLHVPDAQGEHPHVLPHVRASEPDIHTVRSFFHHLVSHPPVRRLCLQHSPRMLPCSDGTEDTRTPTGPILTLPPGQPCPTAYSSSPACGWRVGRNVPLRFRRRLSYVRGQCSPPSPPRTTLTSSRTPPRRRACYSLVRVVTEGRIANCLVLQSYFVV